MRIHVRVCAFHVRVRAFHVRVRAFHVRGILSATCLSAHAPRCTSGAPSDCEVTLSVDGIGSFPSKHLRVRLVRAAETWVVPATLQVLTGCRRCGLLRGVCWRAFLGAEMDWRGCYK